MTQVRQEMSAHLHHHRHSEATQEAPSSPSSSSLHSFTQSPPPRVMSRQEALLQLSGREWEEASWYFLFSASSCFPSSLSSLSLSSSLSPSSPVPECDQEICKSGKVVRWYSEGVLQRSFVMESPVVDVCWAQFFHHSPTQVFSHS